jgi:prepilin-type processing-associated H-X9-DG protein
MNILKSEPRYKDAPADNGAPAVIIPAPEAPARQAAPERILQRIDWQVIRRLDGQLQGDYRSLFYGYGVDFADLREYQPEDDIRYIDWNVTARMDTPYVRQYVEDREITAWFLLDLSPSMDFGAVNRPDQPTHKRDVLVDLTATLARLLTRHGNRIGALFFGGHSRGIDRSIAPRGGRMQVLRLVNDLLKQPQLPKAPFTNLAGLVEGGLHAIKRRSLVFLISDFISAPGWERPLSLLNQHNEVLAIRLWDPRETELPDAGPIILEDAETGEQLYVDTHDRGFRARFAEAARQREANLSEAFKHAGVDALSMSTDEDLVRAIVRFAGIRKQRRH